VARRGDEDAALLQEVAGERARLLARLLPSPPGMLDAEFRIVRATGREAPHVLELLAEHMPGTDVRRRHEWLYERNPHGRSVTVVGYDPRGVPAGITSVFPRRVLVGGNIRLGAIGGDGFVRPAYRRRGLASALHRVCREAMAKEGVEFMYGPPEPHNLKALLRAGSRLVGEVRRYARMPGLHRALVSLSRLAFRRLRLEPLSGLDARVAAVWERVAAFARVSPVRDPTQYAWRFGATPSGRQRGYALVEGGRPLALCALERRGDAVAIVDLFAPPERYVEAARAVADAADARHVYVQLSANGRGASALWRAGFVPRDRKAFQVLAATDDPDAAALFGADSWYYTWADGDVDEVL